ncbi:NAD-glutamate dehydrogenase domain-containing protein [Microbacterium sp. NPDC056044]|uniref:NAD-glutamate dehydrogenase domain-containing protein n=1 Tax=Microbacterium sp. NPDC056044 TaxID=3345690 RepID=UPI0035DEFEE1
MVAATERGDNVDGEARSASVTDQVWREGFAGELRQAYGDEHAALLRSRYAHAVPAGYRENVPPADAARDTQLFEEVRQGSPFAVHLYEPGKHAGGQRALTFVSEVTHPLTRVLPVLTDLGVDVAEARPYVIAAERDLHVCDFALTAECVAAWEDATWRVPFEDAFRAAWTGAAESDPLGGLVLSAGLDWRRVVILRAVTAYLRQIGTPFSVDYVHQTLLRHPSIAAALVGLFEARFDPDRPRDRAAVAAACVRDIEASLDDVTSLDDDRILRAILGVITATVRTNFYQTTSDGTPKPWVSMKLDGARVPHLPRPHPTAEIWVYSPEVEGVHLRFGAVARGGLRWSDRREDFRTEVLGLAKAQLTKNAVIVPTGAKGAFFPKLLPVTSDRTAWLEAGRSAYRTFIRGLLDVTDDRDGARVVRPPRVVRHDGDDPYLVVAADKGTASFSDIANAISAEYGFWLGDAFASGGSAGYDHKAIGITARGAWESVARHFRELGIDVQRDPITAVGIGDMSGDVFGNGMLRSPHVRLVAAFDHRHVFVDPDPDSAAMFTERRRLFELPGSSWDDVDRSLLSAGGGVFPLSAKSVPVSREMAKALGIDPAVRTLTPLELKRAVLLAPVDLLWNGAIGTYVKASDETHAEIGDRGNDAIRVDGRELRVKVIGEGGNLGVSQRGRIEAARAGVGINTDAIDNAAGVGISDREVNLKILLSALERAGRLARPERDALLASMTDEVAEQVLRDNYEQNVLLGNSRANAAQMLPSHARLIAALEERGMLDRALEHLPGEAEIAARAAKGEGLTRPEFAVLLAYAKLALKADLAASGLADDPWFDRTLAEYFPTGIRQAYAEELQRHPLRTEIVVNSVVNSMVNRGGITFVHRASDETGASVEQITRAYVVVREILDLRGFVAAVETLDGAVDTTVQTELLLTFRRLLDRAARWLVLHRSEGIDIGEEIATFGAAIPRLLEHIDTLQNGTDHERFVERVRAFEAAGVPTSLARWGSGLLEAMPLFDVIERARAQGTNPDDLAAVHYALANLLQFDDLLLRISALPQHDHWSSAARAATRSEAYAVMIDISAKAAHDRSQDPHALAEEPPNEWLSHWFTRRGDASRSAVQGVRDAIAAPVSTGLSSVSVALRRLRSLVG